jgi:thiol-disulfide isomerase/thioredoxin
MDEPTTTLTESEDEAVSSPSATTVGAEPVKTRNWTTLLLGLIVALLGVVIVLQSFQLQRSSDLEREVVALEADVTDLKPLRRDIDVIGEQMATLDEQVAAAVKAASSPAAITTSQAGDGRLPQFESAGNDPAVITGMILPEIDGPEYYSGTEVSYTADDGKARIWMIWAHWCPYCQAELPDLSEWWPENASRFPSVELVTVTTAIDETRGNPLLDYLDSSEFSFPVVLDDTGEIASRFGTSAFPFWVVTDANGAVVFRTAGALGIENIDQIFAQLETISSET